MFRAYIPPFLFLCAIALPCWLAFRVNRLRTRGHLWSRRRELVLLTFVLYLLGLVAVTLSPPPVRRARAAAAIETELHVNPASLTCSSAPRGSRAHGFCVDNAVGNVVLFLPLGVLLPLVLGRLRFGSGVLIAIALSSSIELIQFASRGWSQRTADVNDVILNSLGACLGLVVVLFLRRRQGSRSSVPRA